MSLDFIRKVIMSDTFAVFVMFVLLFREARAESKKLEAKKRKNK